MGDGNCEMALGPLCMHVWEILAENTQLEIS